MDQKKFAKHSQIFKLKLNQYSLKKKKKRHNFKKLPHWHFSHTQKLTMYFFTAKIQSCDFCTNFINKQYICHDFNLKEGNHLKTLFN